ncbi:MAG TPA: YCF48-related protein [Ignavibacteria bacterium]|nr:YCF48-related protein [Ignavibacteria bacterium]
MNNVLKIIFITFLFIYPHNSHSQDFWSVIESPTTKNLTDISFINSNTGWIAGDSGIIIRTTNGGTDWTVQSSGTFNNIEDIFFLNERLGWAVSYEIFPVAPNYLGTLMLTTTDGGDTWLNEMYPDTNLFLSCVFFVDSLKGFMGGVSSTILMTTNNGNNWAKTRTDSTLQLLLPVFKVKFFNDDPDIGYACGGFRDIAGITWVTRDGGFNWEGTVLAPEPFFDLTILNDQKTICSGGDLEYGSSIARTTNQGMNWLYDTLGVFGLSYGIDQRTPSEIWMASGYSEKFLFSRDTGLTWTPFPAPENTAVFDIVFTDTIYGFSCGGSGKILKYDRTTSSINIIQNQNFPEEYILKQNYPNPFNPTTNLEFGISEPGFVNLKVFDVLGNEVATLVNEKMPAGNYNYQFSTVNYQMSSGVYFYSLTVNGILTDTKRMLLLK